MKKNEKNSDTLKIVLAVIIILGALASIAVCLSLYWKKYTRKLRDCYADDELDFDDFDEISLGGDDEIEEIVTDDTLEA